MSQCYACNKLCAPTLNCTVCKSVWFCDSKCRDDVNVSHNCQANSTPNLRYTLNTDVYVSVGEVLNLTAGRIVKLWPTKVNPYEVQLHNGTSYQIQLDSDHLICKKDFELTDARKVLLHHVKRDTSLADLQKIIAHFGKKWTDYADFLMHSSASCGNVKLFSVLSKQNSFSFLNRDEKGRTILHLAIISKMQNFACLLVGTRDSGIVFRNPTQYDDLLYARDDQQRNAVHYLVLSNDSRLRSLLIDAVFVVVKRTYKDFGLTLLAARDSKGRTPLDYAISFKRVDEIKLLCDRLVEIGMLEVMQIGLEKTCHLLDKYKRTFTFPGITLENHVFVENNFLMFSLLVNSTYVKVQLDCLQWLLEGPWQLDIRLSKTRGLGDYYRHLCRKCLFVEDIRFVDLSLCEDSTLSREDNIQICLLHGIYRLCQEWNGSDSFEYHFKLQMYRERSEMQEIFLAKGSRNRTAEFAVLPHDERFDLTSHHISKYIGGHKEQKQLLIFYQYLVKRAQSLGEEQVSIAEVVLADKHPMLSWFVDHFELDWNSPVKNHSGLMSFLATLPWTKLTGHGLDKDTPLLDCLLAYAASVEAIHTVIFLWSLKGDRELAPFCGLNLLQIATLCGNYLVVKMLMATGAFRTEDLRANDISVLDFAIQYHHEHVCKLFVPAADLRHWENPKWVGASLQFALNEWADQLQKSAVIAELGELMALRMPPQSMLCALSASSRLLGGFTWSEIRAVSLTSVKYRRMDVCKWLCDSAGIKDSIVSRFRRECLDFATRNRCTVVCWHLQHLLSRLQLFSPLKAAIIVQSAVRRHLVWRRCKHLFTSARFLSVWKNVVWELWKGSLVQIGWLQVKAAHAMVASQETEAFEGINAHTTSFTGGIMQVAPPDSPLPSSFDTRQEAPVSCVDLSQSALKWFQSADISYQKLFQKRIAQLAAGERSYALSKRLQHCAYPVYETKLDVGVRILWTKVHRGAEESILVWFVSAALYSAHLRLAGPPVKSVIDWRQR